MSAGTAGAAASSARLRVVSFNMHSERVADRRVASDPVADVIAAATPTS